MDMERSLSLSNRVFIANRLDCLADELMNRFLESENLRNIIIIPSHTVKEFILQHFTTRLGYAVGVRFLTLPQAVEYFAKLTGPITRPPEHLSLMLHVESEIRSSRSPELLDYLQNDEEKIYSLAEEMSHVFLHYGLYGYKALKEWEQEQGWQQEIWRRLRAFWDFPCDSLAAFKPPKIPHAVHLFDITHTPLLYASFFNHLSKFWNIFTYFRSPTPLYWGDLLSQKALARNPELEMYDLETNPHLANFGTLGKRLYSFLSEKDCEELYEPYDRNNALGSIKQDIYELSSSEISHDESLEMYSCPTKMREVEILLANLEKAGSEDVLVLAPNMNDYFPYIQFVFEKESCPFGYLVTDLSLLSQNSYIRTLSHFFSLAESRFEPESILELLSSPHFKTKEDLSLLHKITERVHWGYNREMREEILECEGVGDTGTWDSCFQSLLRKLAYASSPIELSKAENFGELIELLQNLYEDLWSLKKKKATLKEWMQTIEALLEKYFIYSEETEMLLSELHSCSLIEGEFSYPSIRRVLRELFEQNKESRAFLSKPAARFASLKDGIICDADVICLMGMDEDSFPRKNTFRSINQLKYSKKADIQPEQGEIDRYLLLQALLSARKNLFISYVNTSPKDGKEVGPSLLLDNLCPIQLAPHEPQPISSPARFSTSAPATATNEIPFSSLAKLARHPLAFYCNEALGIYLDKKKEEDEFILTYQQKAELRNAALFKNVDEVLQNTGVLFQNEAKEELLEEIEELKSNVATLGLRPTDFSSLRFDLSCQRPTKMPDGSTIFPAIQFEDSKIHGEISRITPQGLFVFGKDSFTEYWKYLPHILIMAQMGLPTTLLFGKDAKVKHFTIADPKKALASYLNYYRDALTSASPLLPEQAEKLYKGKKIGELTSFFEDPYLDYIKPDLTKPWEDIVHSMLDLM